MSYYYPEGYFGPICDSEINPSTPPVYVPPGEVIPDERKLFLDAKPAPNPEDPTASQYLDQVLPDTTQLWKKMCRFDEDGAPFDCELIFTKPFPDEGIPFVAPNFDKFSPRVVVPQVTSDSCIDFDADINIRPITRFNPDGTSTTYTRTQRSTPVTFPVYDEDLWSTEANKYAVWVNNGSCNLPGQTQIVTYNIPIPATDTYTITGGADNSMSIFLGSSTTALTNFDNAVGGIFLSGSYTSPYSTTQTLNAGTLQMVVQCTNDTGGTGYGDNPGGWYIKICRGTGCYEQTTSSWMRAGPHQLWPAFMNTYAAFPSNTDPTSGSAQTTSISINIETAGNYVLEVAADDTASFTWDGASIGSSSSTTSSSININTVSTGPHTLGISVTNNTPASGTADTWANNPGGVAYTLSLGGTVVSTSLDLVTNTTTSSNLIWHTRLGTGYALTTT